MPVQLKTEAIVLRKLDYGDTSKIATFYSKDFGKISGIIKGARSPKSKIGMMVDVMNHLEIVFYQKDTRDVQLVSQVNIVSHYPKIKEDLTKLKYASAILELISNLTPENESSEKLYRGIIRILELINSDGGDPREYFIRFFLFMLKEMGYEIQMNKCAQCGNSLGAEKVIAFNYSFGFLCKNCREERIVSFEFQQELFNLLVCLNGKKNEIKYNSKDYDKLIFVLEKYLIHHIPEFKGIKSFNIY